ncbi:MAG: hypothetical protein AB2L24_29400 [Mangrovibacterium sp.]
MSVLLTKECEHVHELMVSDYVKLSFSSTEGVTLPIGSYIVWNGATYRLLKPYTPTPKNELEYRYEPEFQSKVMGWSIKPFFFLNKNSGVVISRETDWQLTGTLYDFLNAVVASILDETGETYTFSIDASLAGSKTISFSSSDIFSALNQIAGEWETEWWVEGTVIHFGECAIGSPTVLESGVHVSVPEVTKSDRGYYTRFYAFGSTRNIEQDYTSGTSNTHVVQKRLALPVSTCPNGYKDIREDLTTEEISVKVLTFNNIYPKSHLTISDVRSETKYRLDGVGNKIKIGTDPETGDPVYETYKIYFFKVPNLSFDPETIIEGKKLSVHFNSGYLLDLEFELVYHEDKEDEGHGEFEIILDESTGVIIPNEVLAPANGDQVVLFNINLPQEYTDAAEAELEEALDAAITEYLTDDNTYKVNSFPVKFHNDGISLKVGSRVTFINGDNILNSRVLAITEKLDFPDQKVITIGRSKKVGTISQLKQEVKKINVVETKAESLNRQSVSYTKRLFGDAQETINMLESAFNNFSGSINPVTVRTIALLVGDESLQFRFVNSIENPVTVAHNVTYDAEEKTLTSPAGIIQHMTLGITSISSNHAVSEYKFWNMAEYESSALTESTKAYYLYAKVSKTEQTGEFILSETAIGMESVDGFYHLLVGVLNSENNEGGRSYVDLYGFSELLPGRLTTDKIVSGDGSSYFDMVNAALKLKDKVLFNVNGDGLYKFKGIIAQSESGDEFPIGVYRGAYDPDYTYYKGDEVTHDGSSWTYIYDVNSEEADAPAPVEGTYWHIKASKGSDGIGAVFATIDNNNHSLPTTSEGVVISYAGSNATIKVTEGSTSLIYNNTGVAGTFNVSVASTAPPASITPGTRTGLGTNTCSIGNCSNMSTSTDIVTITYQITVYRLNGTTVYLNLVQTFTKSKEGSDGRDGTDYEFIFTRTTTASQPDTPPTSQVDDYVPDGWTDNIQGVTLTYQYEWVSKRTKTEGVWSAFSDPKLWAKFSVDGGDGSDGANARYVTLTAAANAVNFDTAGNNPSPSSIVLTAMAYNLTGTAYYEFFDNDTSLGAASTTNTKNLSLTGKTYSDMPRKIEVQVREGSSGGLIVARDQISIIGMKAGQNSVQGIIENSSHTVPASATGVVSSYLGSGTKIQVYEGSTLLTFHTTLAAGRFTVGTPVVSPAGKITVGTRSGSETTTCTVADHSAMDSATDLVTITYPITARKADGTDITFNLIQTITKSKAGSSGSDGDDAPFYEYRYAKNGSTLVPPSFTATSLNPPGWTTDLNSITLNPLEYIWKIVAKKSADGSSLLVNWALSGIEKRYSGSSAGPVMVKKGEYNPGSSYSGSSSSIDVVLFNSVFYRARVDAGTFSGVAPTDTSKWNTFGVSADSVATDLLFATLAYIENLGVRFLRTATTGERIFIDGDANAIKMFRSADTSTPTTTLSDAGMRVEFSGYKFLRINESPTSPMLAVRSDDYVPVSISTYGDSPAALQIISNNGSGKAIESYGNHVLTARSGETIQLNGVVRGNLHLNTYITSESNFYIDDDDCYVVANKSTAQNIYLPLNPQIGRNCFVKKWQNNTVTVYGNGNNIRYGSASTAPNHGLSNNDELHFYHYDGAYWEEQIFARG